ncbi:alpha/beta hydrolase [Dyadobacter sp. CY261]|uniref:alpha/beta hydrolase fold domain-containing protein n=1 Tax=Dyadobacter sp. CY261 TaxID=2907203 RepID=UPI001F20493B|nr:alpha/beta hydrolase fold domain-containing protein [Dyadobacter sp. CY261]MCF0074268.1 alpha/beta hydrolase [Dyadobacter sp. CY261]
MKTQLILILAINILIPVVQAQSCNTGELDPRVAHALKTVLHDLPGSPATSVEQIRDVRVPVQPFLMEDQTTLKSYQKYATGYFQTKAFSEFAIQKYAPNEDLNNPEIGPINQQDLGGLPPALVLTAEFDPLRDEGRHYAQKLRKAKVQVWEYCFAGQIHCLLGLPPDSKEQQHADQLLLTTMQAVLNR